MARARIVDLRMTSVGAIRRTLYRFLFVLMIGFITVTIYLTVQDAMRGVMNLYSFIGSMITIGIALNFVPRFAYHGCLISAVSTISLLVFVLSNLYVRLADYQQLLWILSTTSAGAVVLLSHYLLRKRKPLFVGRTFAILAAYLLTAFFAFSLTGREKLGLSVNIAIIDFFALIVTAYLYISATNQAYREVVVTEIGLNVIDPKTYPTIRDKLLKETGAPSHRIRDIVYMIESAIDFFKKGDYDRSIIECYRVKEGIDRILKVFKQTQVTDIVEKKQIKNLDQWRSDVSHSGIPTKRGKMVKKRVQKKGLSQYRKAIQSLSIVKEILEKI